MNPFLLLGPAGLRRINCRFITATVTFCSIGLSPAVGQVAGKAPHVISLCSVGFDLKDHSRISREGRACLDDIALNLQKSTDSTVALIGNADRSEKAAMAPRRASLVKQYLVLNKGVGADRITLYTGQQRAMTVAVDLIPANGKLDTTGLAVVPDSKLR